jgi:hypothetical protein
MFTLIIKHDPPHAGDGGGLHAAGAQALAHLSEAAARPLGHAAQRRLRVQRVCIERTDGIGCISDPTYGTVVAIGIFTGAVHGDIQQRPIGLAIQVNSFSITIGPPGPQSIQS